MVVIDHCLCKCVCVPGSSPFQMVLDKRRHWADLNGVGVVGRVFEQAVVRIEQLLRQEEEELSGWTAVVQPRRDERTERRGIHACLILGIFGYMNLMIKHSFCQLKKQLKPSQRVFKPHQEYVVSLFPLTQLSSHFVQHDNNGHLLRKITKM